MSTLFGSSSSNGSSTQPAFFNVSTNNNVNSANGTSSNASGAGTSQHNPNDPGWFQNTKKRTITNHLVPKRKSAFQLTSSSAAASASSDNGKTTRGGGSSKNNVQNLINSDSSSEYNLVTFGSNQRKALTGGASGSADFDTSSGDLSKYHDTINETINDDFPLYNNSEDLPPSRSIYDLNDEVLISLNRPSNQYADSSINKDPKNFNNVFTNKSALTDTSNSVGASSGPASASTPSSGAGNSASAMSGVAAGVANVIPGSGTGASGLNNNPLNHGESAILVFGYPESMANQVIAHFQELGTILEDFEVNKSTTRSTGHSLLNQSLSTNKSIVPIFSGKSWVKITYDNPSSAVEALQENGSVFNGVLLGVIPYTKAAIEKLQKRKLTENEDIGGGIESRQALENANALNTSGNGVNNDITNGATSHIKKLEIKDGSEFFLKANNNDPTKSESDKKNDANLNIWGKTLKFFFGFNEL